MLLTQLLLQLLLLQRLLLLLLHQLLLLPPNIQAALSQHPHSSNAQQPWSTSKSVAPPT
jgi:hypothetical protein